MLGAALDDPLQQGGNAAGVLHARQQLRDQARRHIGAAQAARLAQLCRRVPLQALVRRDSLCSPLPPGAPHPQRQRMLQTPM